MPTRHLAEKPLGLHGTLDLMLRGEVWLGNIVRSQLPQLERNIIAIKFRKGSKPLLT